MKKIIVLLVAVVGIAFGQVTVKGVELGGEFDSTGFQLVREVYVKNTTLGGVEGVLMVSTTSSGIVANVSFKPDNRVSSATRSTLIAGIEKNYGIEIEWKKKTKYLSDEVFRVEADGVLFGGISEHNQFMSAPYDIQLVWFHRETQTKLEAEQQAKANDDF